MAFGPFDGYLPPGVYTQTKYDANFAAVLAGLRVPFLIGEGQEELEQNDLELIRGSSSMIDQQINSEDVTLRWIVDDSNPNNPILGATDGTLVKFVVRNFPIVDGQGTGRTTNDARNVEVRLNGDPVAVGSVKGATGEITLQVPPAATDTVRVTYFFHRGDTAFTDDVSSQVTATAAEITTPAFEPFNVVAGVSDTLSFKVDGGAEKTITFTASSTTTASSIKTQIDSALISGLSTSVFTTNEGKFQVKLSAQVSLEITAGNANGMLGLSSGQKTNRNATFTVFQRPIVDGSSGGITTTDTSKVVVKVNNVQVIPASVDGANGSVTLSLPPAVGANVQVEYFANTWQDTFDYLPNTLVTNVLRAGISPGRSDYIQGQDFVISNPSADVSVIHWGASYSITPVLTTPGATVFDSSQIVPTLVDDKLYLASCTRYVDSTVVPARTSDRDFVLPAVPTVGNGRDTPLGAATYSSVANSRQGVTTDRPDLVTVYVGRTMRDATSRPAVKVTAVDGPNRRVTLRDPVPANYNAYATFWYNRLSDDTFTLTNKTAGAYGAGQYELFSSALGANVYFTRFGTKGGGLTETVRWPRGVEQVPDAMHADGVPVSETVTVTFSSDAATNAVFTSRGAAPWSFYTPSSGTWRSNLNGAGALATNLATATRGFLVSQSVALSGGNITISTGVNDVLALTIDGVEVNVTLTGGSRTPTQIATDVNTAIDANAAFSGTAPNALFAHLLGPGSSRTFFVIRSYSTPAALPGGFDHASYVQIREGTAEEVLGFTTFQRADGTPTAINKPATILGEVAQPYVFTAGVDDTLLLRINGVDFTVPINTASTSAANVVSDINAVISSQGTASVGTLGNLNQVRITSTLNSDQSSVTILGGTANEVLGFNEGDFANQTRVSVQEVVDRLMATSNFAVSSWPTVNASGAVAYPTVVDGQTYLTIESLTVGTSSSVAFVTGSNSAFNTMSGTLITPGTDGDSGEAATDKFTVTSSNPLGSAGTGYPGQTYTDARTGLRFSVLPAQDGSYTSSGYFTLIVSPTFDVNPAVPLYAVPGLELIVTDTVGVGVNDTANLQTFTSSGVEPATGDFYFISYRYMKQDYSARPFRTLKSIVANFGPVAAENRISMGAYLSLLNGAVLLGLKQVKKVPNTATASVASFQEAIAGMATPLAGNIKPDLIVPLSPKTEVQAYLANHCEIQSNIRNQGERMGFIGFASGTTPTQAQTVARSLASNRIVAFYPDSGVVTLQNELGETFETLVDGTFFAAAASGAIVSPAVDVATPYTRRRILGFTRIIRTLDPVEANQTAVAGISVLEDLDPIIRIRQGLTTNMANVLTRLPTVTQIADRISINTRATLDPYVGTKFLSSRANEIEVTLTSMFKGEIQQEIVAAYTGISAESDAVDPTTMNIEGFYQPIFPLLYLMVTYNIRAQL
jgi:hypothetical protein